MSEFVFNTRFVIGLIIGGIVFCFLLKILPARLGYWLIGSKKEKSYQKVLDSIYQLENHYYELFRGSQDGMSTERNAELRSHVDHHIGILRDGNKAKLSGLSEKAIKDIENCCTKNEKISKDLGRKKINEARAYLTQHDNTCDLFDVVLYDEFEKLNRSGKKIPPAKSDGVNDMGSFFSSPKKYLKKYIFEFILVVVILINLAGLYVKPDTNSGLIKKAIIFAMLLTCLIVSSLLTNSRARIENYYRKLENNQDTKNIVKSSLFFTVIAVSLFILSIFLVNIGLSVFSHYVAYAFLFFALISFTDALINMYRDRDPMLNSAWLLMATLSPIVFYATSLYVSSIFYIVSGMPLDLSPLMKLGLTAEYFIPYMFVLIHLLINVAYYYKLNSLNPLSIPPFLCGIILSIFIVNVFLENQDKIFYEIAKYSTDKEWSDDFTCDSTGELKHTLANEKYFRIREGEYKAFYHDRNGHWGFEDIFCKKQHSFGDDVVRRDVSEVKHR